MTEGHEAASGLVGILGSTAVWYGAAVAIFALVIIFVAGKPILAWLDGEIEKIRNELEQAKKLRAEAAEALVDYRARQKEALKEAEGIVARAKEEAARLRAEAERDLKEALEKHEQKAAQIMKQLEADALAEVRAAIVDEAISASISALKSGMKDDVAAKLIEQAIAEIPKMKDAGKAA